MKFVCNATYLSEACFTVSKACAVKTITPILECIKIKAENDVLYLSAYDGEISIKKQIKAEVLEEGEVCVNGKFFSDFIGKIAQDEVVIFVDENTMFIKYGDSETNMQILPASDFPAIDNEVFSEAYIEVKQEDLKTLISDVVFCAATDDSRPILKGILLETKNGVLCATALDGFRLAVSYCNASVSNGEMKIVCPARTLSEILRMLGDEETLKIHAHKNRLSVAIGNTVINSRLYAGEFVRKENIFPVMFATKIVVNKSELMQSVERAAVLIRGDKNNLITLTIKNNKINIKANSEIGKVEETVNAELNGEDLIIAMNGKYLLDALKGLDEEEILISFNNSVAPFVLENKENKRNQYLVLPVRMGN